MASTAYTHTTSKKHRGCVSQREHRKKCFISAFEAGRVAATADDGNDKVNVLGLGYTSGNFNQLIY